jgi:type III secretory pathway component EscV
VSPARLPAGIDGDPGDHPSSGALASWVPEKAAAALETAGIRLFRGEECIALRLDASLHACASELIGLEETQRLLDALSRQAPALVRQVVPARVDLGALAEILRRLVAEGLSVSDLREVLETLARQKDDERDPVALTERVRAAQRRLITHRHARNHRVDALVLDADAEEAVRGAIRPGRHGARLALEPDLHDALLAALKRELEGQAEAVLLTSPELRRHVRRLVEEDHPRLPVLAYDELLGDVQVERVGTIRLGA